MKRRLLEEEHRIFQTAVRSFLEKEAVPYFDQWEEERMVPREFWIKLGKQGYLCPQAAEQYGGIGADFIYNVIINEEFARVGLGLMGVGLHNDIIAPYLETYGSTEQKERWLPKCISGESILAIAMTEPGAGSDLQAIKSTAFRDGDSYILNGQKTFISNGICSDLVLVACKTDPKAQPTYKGISLMMVERDTPGFTRGRKLDKMGMHSQDTAELFFEDCRVPAENLLGEEGKGFYCMMNSLPRERLVTAITSQVAAEEMLRETLEYTGIRKAFGKSLKDQQHIQFKLAELKSDIVLGRTFVDRVIEAYLAGEDMGTESSIAKWWVTDMANRVAYQCLQLHGGYGYMEEYPIARWYRDIRVAPIYAGSNEIMKTLIARTL